MGVVRPQDTALSSPDGCAPRGHRSEVVRT